jgi:MFS family permease
MAKLSDFLGRRSIYIIALAIFGIGSAIVSFTESYVFLLVGRAIQGIGVSGIFPIATATIGDAFPIERRGRVLGLIGMVFGLAFIMGPVIAGILLKYFAWHTLFVINLPICAVLIWQSHKLMPSVRHGSINNFDWKGVLTLAVFLAGFTYAINLVKPDDLLESITAVPFLLVMAISLISLALFIPIEQRSVEPVLNLNYMKSRQITIAGFIAFGTGLFQATFVFFPKMAVAAFSVSSSEASFMLVPTVIAVAIGAPVGGRLIDKVGPRLVILIGLFLSILGLFILSFLDGEPLHFYIPGAILGFGLSFLVGSSLRYIILNEVSERERASSQGIITIFGSIGQILGAVVIGVMVTAQPGLPGYRHALFVFSLTTLVFLFSAWFLKAGKYTQEAKIS